MEKVEPEPTVDADSAAQSDTADDARDSEESASPTPPSEGNVAEEAVDDAGQVPACDQEPVDPIEELKARVASLEDNLLRAKADYQNLQRRSAQERSVAVQYANAELMRSLLDVVDDLQRSLEAANACQSASSLADGIRLVYENLMKTLRLQGLEVISALHQPFDPHVHQAMMQQPSKDHPPGTVLEEITRGYRLRDRVLRPAKVVVSEAVDAETDQEPDQLEGDGDRGARMRKKWKRRK